MRGDIGCGVRSVPFKNGAAPGAELQGNVNGLVRRLYCAPPLASTPAGDSMRARRSTG